MNNKKRNRWNGNSECGKKGRMRLFDNIKGEMQDCNWIAYVLA